MEATLAKKQQHMTKSSTLQLAYPEEQRENGRGATFEEIMVGN